MKILAIETSCDDTSIAILENNIVISTVIYSQINEHKKFGGVVPEIASRIHSKKIFLLIEKALSDANINIKEIDKIAVTGGPGLIGTLQVGLIVAKTLSLILNIPFYIINHLEGHIYSAFIGEEESFIPLNAIFLIISGGHTIIGIKNKFEFKYLGETRDDAIGETYDKVAKIFNLPYPSGKYIDELLEYKEFDNLYDIPKVNLKNYDFSYSGLKTWMFNASKKEEYKKEKLLFSFQKQAIEQLFLKIEKAYKEFNINNLIIVGGVSSNSYLRKETKNRFKDKLNIFFPKKIYSTDNAAMIGYTYYLKRNKLKESLYSEDAKPNWKIE
ncbi:MAG: tRNA N6-adenosine threonylcarbamoyltransferase [Candidatus Hepatoplasma vulgare]|nr:MAG: tRNA N6-adenosine threonylcarbamoyltransferase [Candidatus Hepatoplasma sp.]